MYLEVSIVGLLAGIAPGPDFVVVMKNSLGYGRSAGRATALGIASALVIHVSYTILGFAFILQHYPTLFHLIQLAGAGYLVWLGWHALRSRPAREGAAGSEAAAGEPGTKNSLDGFREFYNRSKHWFDRTLGAVLMYFAARIIWSVVKG